MAGREGDLPAQQIRPGLLELIQRSRLRGAQQPQRRIERAGLILSLRGGECAHCARRRPGRQRGGAFEERGRRGQPAARLRPAGASLQFGGDVLIGPRCGLGPVPGPAVGIGARIGGLGDSKVGAAAVAGRGRVVDGRADQRMAEDDPAGDGEQPVCLGRGGGVGADAKISGGPPQQRRVAGWLGRGQQEQPPGRLRERRDPPQEALLDPARHRERAGHAEPAGQLRRGRPVRQFEQGQRVAAGLGDDPVADPLIQAAGEDRGQQRPGVSIRQSGEHQLRKASQVVSGAGVTRAEQHGDRFGVQAAGCERQRLRRGLVQPLGIIDQAQQRLVRGHLREQAQDSQADQEPIRGAAGAQAECDAQSVALRGGQLVQAIQHPPAQLLQRRVRQLHLRLDALRLGHLEILCRVGRVAQ